LILETIRQAQARTGQSIEQVLAQLELPPATYYRWQARERDDHLTDTVVVPCRRVPSPTPEEIAAVCSSASVHSAMGYKRLAWLMVDEDGAYLRPWQVYRILSEYDLLRRVSPASQEPLRRPPEPDRPDQVWHVDLMYLYIEPRWYYLVDILDGYSRFLVHWSLNLTMLAETVTLTVQEALEKLSDRRPGRPKIVHDRGSQFLSAEWRRFVEGSDVTDIKTRVAHPQSNGRVERLHRTHREEGLLEEELTDYHQALEVMERWSHYYNHKRPHSALKYLRPVDYYRGDPGARLAEREQKLSQALEARKLYWQGI
jgi:putative transposase